MTGILFTLVAAALAVWALVAISHQSAPSKRKIIWFAIIILIPVLGPLLYFFVGKERL